LSLSLKIGTRSSPLALWQAEWVKARLLEMEEVAEVELVKIKTSGDKILDVPLAKVGGKGLFTKEIEEALLRRDADLAVHSMKDVPTDIPDGLKVDVIPEREDPSDALISRGIKLADLPPGAQIGTSSLRRRAQLKRLRPDFVIVDLRGNIETRLRKLDSENLDAVILASAGIKRMGYTDKITERLSGDVMLPAVGQGALAIETRINDETVNRIVGRLHHRPTAVCVLAERVFLKKLEGGCQVPIAGHATLEGANLTLEGLVGDLDGQRLIRETQTGPADDYEKIGIALAEQLLEQGAAEILAEVYGETS